MPRALSRLAKIMRPRVRQAVARECLFARLDERGGDPLLWIAGPPGAGKTTLVATWLTARGIPGIWYQVDAGDADPSSLFYYLGLAVTRAQAGKQRPLPLLTPEYQQDLGGFTRRFGRELFSRLPRDAVLVLDNFQEVAADVPLQRIVSGLIAEVPAGQTVIAISRSEPPPEFVRQLTKPTPPIVDWAALRLTLDEAAKLVRVRVPADSAAIADLHKRSDGWAAGLTLLADQFARTGRVEALQGTESLQAIFDYFASQVFSAARPQLQEFLLRTAFLARMTPAMAQAVGDDTDATRLLEELCRRNLFTDRRAAEVVTYQYHALFRTFLMARARERYGAVEVSALQCLAGAALQAGGQIEEAVNAFLGAAAWPQAVDAIVHFARELLRQGRGQTLRAWVALLPGELVRSDPWLLYWAGTSMIPVDRPAARAQLEQAFALFEASGDRAGQAMAAAGIIETHFTEMVRFAQMDPWIDAVDRALAGSELPDADAELSVYSAALVGTLYRQPGHRLLAASVERVWRLLDSDTHTSRKLTAATFLLVYCIYVGELDLGRQVIAKGKQFAVRPDASALSVGLWLDWVGHFHQHHFDVPMAIASLDRAQAVARQHGLPHVEFLSLYFRGMTHAMNADWDEARTCVARMEATIDPNRRHLVAVMCSLKGWIALLQAKPEAALQAGKPAFDLGVELGSPSYRVHWGLAWVFGLLETGRRDEASRLILEARAALHGTAIRCFEPLLLCLEARCAELNGDSAHSFALVRRMFETGELTHCIYLSWLAPYVRRYAAMALEAGIATGYVCSLVRMAGWAPASPYAENWPWRWKIRTLGRFEVLCDDQPLAFGRKAPRKPLALLRALIALGETAVAEQELIDHLWPDEEGDAARKALATTLHRLRVLLGSPDVVELSEGRLSLDTGRVWVDVRAFQGLLSEADAARRHVDEPRQAELVQRALELYRGTFLPQDPDAPWALSTRERLRSRFVQHVGALGQRLERDRQFERGIECYLRGLEADDLAELFYLGLMRCYAGLNRYAEAWGAYRRLRQALSVTLGIPPSPESESLARTLLAR